jgi:dolichol-phosphate mannosyltransferase
MRAGRRGLSATQHADARPDRLWLVLPTYNEAENLEHFAAAVLPELERASRRPHVLVVDDDSPDGTGRIAARLSAEDPRISVLHNGPKRGLGRAYVAGFRHALAAGADLLMEMDADFSHDVADVPRLVAGMHEADLVIGSRYVEGGGVADWDPIRRALSRGGCWYARKVLGLDVRDLTSGFKCYRSTVLSALELDTVRANGYVFQIEMTYRAIRRGYSVAEVPIRFADRRQGTSKMTPAVALEAVWKVPALRAAETRRGRHG